MDSGERGATPTPQADGTPLDAHLAAFLDDKAKQISVEDGETVRSGTYVSDLERVLPEWIDWMEHHGYGSLEELDGQAIGEWARAELAGAVKAEGEGITASTAWKYYSYVSAYLNHLTEWEHMDANPARTGVAKKPMPDRPTSGSTDQQFWSPQQRQTLMQYVRQRAHEAIDEHGSDRAAYPAVRDRAFCAVIAYSAVRGSEVLDQPQDDQPGRNGAAWGDLHLEERRLDVLGKSQAAEDVPLTSKPVEPLRRWRQVLDPPSEDWPLFPTLHRPTLWGTLRESLAERGVEADAIEDELGEYDRPLLACGALEVRPPALTTGGGRNLLRRLTEAAGVDVSEDPKAYLTLHGGRRGAGEQYRREASLDDAQKALRHSDPRVTEAMYSHIEAEDMSEIGDRAFGDE